MSDYDFKGMIYEKRLIDVFSRIIANETEFYKAVILMGQSAIKSSLFINAGALVTVMAFFNANINHIEDGGQKYILLANILVDAMLMWLINILLCIMAYGFAYLNERSSYENFMKNAEDYRHAVIESKRYSMPVDKAIARWGMASCCCVAISYFLFLLSVLLCYRGFSCFIDGFIC